jgi:hypothetical protein
LLHGYVEDTVEDPAEGIAFVRENFGDDIAKIVGALTSPSESEIFDVETRRAAYIKVSDRAQNHITDLVNWYSTGNASNLTKIERINKYFRKSEIHL